MSVSKLEEQFAQLQLAIQEIDARLQSLDLTFREKIGLGLDDRPNDQELLILENNRLSEADLLRKKDLLISNSEELSGQIRSLQAVKAMAELEVQKQQQQQQLQRKQQQQAKLINKFELAPDDFFAEMYADDPEWAVNKAKIYELANKLVAVVGCFSARTNMNDLAQALVILNKTKDLASFETSQDLYTIYAAAAEKIQAILDDNRITDSQNAKYMQN